MVFDDEITPGLGQNRIENSKYDFRDRIPEDPELSHSSLPEVAFIAPESINSEIQRVNEQIDSISDWINQFYKKFSVVCESIGGIKSHLEGDESKIFELREEIDSVKELVNQLNPEKITADINNLHQSIESFDEEAESNHHFMQNVLGQVEDVKKKVEISFKNVETSKLNDNLKKGLDVVKELNEKVNLAVSKSEQAAIEMNNSISDIHKLDSKFEEIKNISDQVRGEVEGLKAKSNELDRIKQETTALRELVEKSLAFSNENKKGIKNLAIKLSEEKNSKFSDYENRLEVILKMLDNFASSISGVKKNIKESEAVVKSSEINKKIQNLELSVLDIQKRIQNSKSSAEISEIREKIKSFDFPLIISEFNKKIQNLESSVSLINKKLKDSNFSLYLAELSSKLATSDSSLFELRKKLDTVYNEVRQIGNRVSKLEAQKDSKGFFNHLDKAKLFDERLEVKKAILSDKIPEKSKVDETKKKSLDQPKIIAAKPAEEKVSFVKRIFGIGEEKFPKPLKSFELPELPPFINKPMEEKSDIAPKKPVLQAPLKMQGTSLLNKKPSIKKALGKPNQQKKFKVSGKKSLIKKSHKSANKGVKRKISKREKGLQKSKVKLPSVVKVKERPIGVLEDTFSLPELPELPELPKFKQKKSRRSLRK